jgi:hypothetical protein
MKFLIQSSFSRRNWNLSIGMQVHIVDIQTATIVFGMLSKRISRSYKRVFKTLKESAAVHEESETIIGFTM